jgi:hypothetical protein
MIEGFQPVITAIGAGIFYSLYWYLNKVVDPSDPTKIKDLDPYPLIATGITGACIGIVSYVNGDALSQVSIGIQLASYMAFTAIIERALKTGYRILVNKYPRVFA